MIYFLIIIVTITITAILSFIVVNKILKIKLHLISLIFCVVASLSASYILPLFTIAKLGLYGTLGLTLLLSVLTAFFIAHYEALKFKVPQFDAFFEPETLPFSISEEAIDNSDVCTGTLLPQTVNSNPLILKNVLLAIYRKTNAGKKKESNKLLKSEGTLNSSDITIDKIIDKAFSLKKHQKYTQALKLFQLVFKLAPNTQHVPVVLIEIANIFKISGEYDKAVKIFEQGLLHPVIKNDPRLVQEFAITADFLRIVKGVLGQHHLDNVEFNKIPPEIYKHIETEFREHRKSFTT